TSTQATSTILPPGSTPDKRDSSQGFLKTVATFFKPKEQKSSLQLDPSKINEISQDTEELFEVMSRAIGEEKEPEKNIDRNLLHRTPENLKALFSDFVEHLDNRYHTILAKLIEKRIWTSEALELLSRKHHLMPSAVIEVINE